MNKGAILAADASRRALLLVAYIRPVCALLAPRRAGASTPRLGTLIHDRVPSAPLVRRHAPVLTARACLGSVDSIGQCRLSLRIGDSKQYQLAAASGSVTPI